LLFDIAIDPPHRILELAIEFGLLHATPMGEGGPRVSLYADNMAILLAPVASDVSKLAKIL
jgi:hypothetical protein